MHIEKDFKDSIDNISLLKEPLSDIIEAFFDTKTENEFVRNLPVVGWLVKSVGVVDKIKTKVLVN
jgi:hypothetical protein